MAAGNGNVDMVALHPCASILHNADSYIKSNMLECINEFKPEFEETLSHHFKSTHDIERIIFGELRYGDVTNEVLKAWNSGHTGGCTTVHANCALSMLSRIRDLLREVLPGELPDVAQSVQLLVHMRPTRNGPVVSEVVETKQMGSSSFMEDLESNNLIS